MELKPFGKAATISLYCHFYYGIYQNEEICRFAANFLVLIGWRRRRHPIKTNADGSIPQYSHPLCADEPSDTKKNENLTKIE